MNVNVSPRARMTTTAIVRLRAPVKRGLLDIMSATSLLLCLPPCQRIRHLPKDTAQRLGRRVGEPTWGEDNAVEATSRVGDNLDIHPSGLAGFLQFPNGGHTEKRVKKPSCDGKFLDGFLGGRLHRKADDLWQPSIARHLSLQPLWRHGSVEDDQSRLGQRGVCDPSLIGFVSPRRCGRCWAYRRCGRCWAYRRCRRCWTYR